MNCDDEVHEQIKWILDEQFPTDSDWTVGDLNEAEDALFELSLIEPTYVPLSLGAIVKILNSISPSSSADARSLYETCFHCLEFCVDVHGKNRELPLQKFETDITYLNRTQKIALLILCSYWVGRDPDIGNLQPAFENWLSIVFGT